MLAELERTGEDQISLTDPDSHAMAAHTHVAVGYNVQVAVDTKHKLIVEQQVINQHRQMGVPMRGCTIIGGSTPLSAISPPNRQTQNPHNPVSTFPGEGHLPTMISRNLCKDLGQLGGGLRD